MSMLNITPVLYRASANLSASSKTCSFVFFVLSFLLIFMPTNFLALFTLITVVLIPKANTIYWIMPLNFANVNRVLADDNPRPNY